MTSPDGVPAPGSGARGFPPPPLARWQLTWRYAVVSLPILLGLAVLVLLRAGGAEGEPGWRLVLDVGGFGVSLGLTVLRRRRPLLVAVLVTLIVGVSTLSFGVWAWVVVSMATRRRWREVLITGAAALVSVALSIPMGESFFTVADPTAGDTLMRVTTLVTLAILVLVTYAGLVAWGFYLGARRDLVASLQERAEIAEHEQALRAAQARADERARIAREMHDVLAHRISLMSMHAGILAYREDLTPEETREIAAIIQSNASDSLTELRAVLGTLRQPGQPPPKPQPTLADLPSLLEEASAAGARVTLTDTVVEQGTLPVPTGRHAYRIIQEALTNARKHAVGAPVTLALSGGPQAGLAIEVSNPLTADAGLPGAGLGLVGLAERAEIAGGTCTAQVEAGRFVVRAWFPWQT